MREVAVLYSSRAGEGRAQSADPDVNRSGGQAERTPYVAVWMNLMTVTTGFPWPKFRLTML